MTSARKGCLLIIFLVMAMAGPALFLLALCQPATPAHAAPLRQVPSNDDFANALVISALPYSNTQNTISATTQAQDPVFPCIANSGTTNNGRGWHSVWYVYTATVTGTLHVDTIGSAYDTVLGVWRGAWGSLTNVGCDDDSGGNWTSSLNASVVSGTTYYIEVAGYYSTSSGNMALSTDLVTSPANDDIDNAFIISATPYTYTQDTALATTASDDPSLSCGATGQQSHSVWYRFTAPGSGRLYLDTNSSSYDTVLAVWTGSRGSLTQVTCDDDSGAGLASYVAMAVTTGATYHIEIVSYNDGAGGSLALHAIFATTKPLYLHYITPTVTIVDGTSANRIMDRQPVWGGETTAAFTDQPAYFYLSPGLASGLALYGTIVVPLYLDGDTAQSSNVTASLVDLAPDGSTVTIGSATLVVAQNASGWYVFNIPNVAYTVAQGHALRLGLSTQNPSRRVTLRYDSATRNSRVELPSQNLVNVDWARTYDSTYPAGAERTTFVVDTPMYVRASASDPFGSYDITTATLAISNTDYAISLVYDSGADYRIYEAVYTPTSVGTYLYTVTVGEGSERTVTDTATGQFYVSYYGVSVEPDAMLTTDPNTSVDYGLTIRNIGATTDTFEITVTASTQGWATALYLASTLIASDTNGNGTWEWVNPAYDADGDGNPDFRLIAGETQDLILKKTVPPSVGEGVDTTRLVATSQGDTRANDAAILTTSTVIGAQRKQLHLLESGVNDTMSTRPGSLDSTITLARGVSQTWVQSPPFASAFDLRQGALTVNFYGTPSGNNTIAQVTVYSGTTSLGFDQHTIASTGWQTFTIANPNVVVPASGVLSMVIANTSIANRSFTVQYGGLGAYDARLDMPTKTYVKVEQVQTRSACSPNGSSVFNQGQTMTITARVSDPFGSYDIAGANVRVTDPGGVIVVPGLVMNPVLTATDAITYERTYAIPFTATPGIYTIVVTGAESNGVTATRSALFTVQRAVTLTAMLSAAPVVANVGQAVTLTMIVTNGGQAEALGVTPSALTLGGTGSAVLASGPVPTSVLTLTAGSATAFTWVYTATSPVTVTWSGNATGTDANSCADIAAPVATTTVTIASPQVRFSSATYDAGESAGTATITVTLDAPSSLTVTVDYATSNGTAIAGSDYVASSDTLTFAPGVTSRTFTVSILPDALDENDETILLTLSNSFNAAITGTNPATLTILDDDASPTVQFSSGSYIVDEGDGIATIQVILSVASGLTVTVNYATSDGTAIASSDYTASNGTLTFPPGVASQNWVVPIMDDGANEPDETVILTLSAASNTTIGGVNPATLTIIDDDAAPGQVTIDKSVFPSTIITPGQWVTYTYIITIYNAGPSTVYVQQITDTLPTGFTYITTTATSGIRYPDSITTSDRTIIWICNLPYPALSAGSSAILTFLAGSSSNGGCNSAGVTIGGGIGIVARDNMACVGWPVYEIVAHVGSQTIRVYVRMVNGQPVILSWEIR